MLRHDLYRHLQGKTGVRVAEIGVLRGEFTDQYKSFVNGDIHLIDIWTAEGNDQYFSTHAQECTDALSLVRRKYSNAANIHIHVQDSVSASKTFPDNYFDVVYLDANHEYPHPLNDIRAWMPKVKPGGLLAGHDFDKDIEKTWGVERSVREVFGNAFSCTDESEYWSWYVQKPASEGYLLFAFGDKYVQDAVNFVKSLRSMGQDQRPVTVVANAGCSIDLPNVNVINKQETEFDCLGRTDFEKFCVIPRVTADRYTPYDKTMHLDCDSLCIHPTADIWKDFASVPCAFIGKRRDPEWHWGKMQEVEKLAGMSLPHIHGGLIYFTKESTELFKQAQYFYRNCDSFGVLRQFRGAPPEEMLFALACGKLDIVPFEYGKQRYMNWIFSNVQLPTDVCSRYGKVDKPFIFVHMHERKQEVYDCVLSQCLKGGS